MTRWLLLLLAPVVGCAAPMRIGDDRLSLELDDGGHIRSVVSDGAELLWAEARGGLTAYDIGEGQGPLQLSGEVSPAEGGAQVDYRSAELGLRVLLTARAGERHTIALDILVEDLREVDRGLTLEFGLPLGTDGWTWWDAPDTSRPVRAGERYANLTRLRALPGLPEFDDRANLSDFGSYSWYPVAAVTGPSGLGLAKPPRAAGLFRLGFDGDRGVLYSAYDFALSQDTAEPGCARFSLVLFPVEPSTGFRGALAELYDLWPEDFTSRVPSYGGWMPFQRLSKIEDVDEFGFAYQEGASEPAFDDTLGVSSFVYFHCAGEFANIPGYTRDQELPPYEEQLAAVNAVVKQRTGIDNLWDITGIQGPDGRITILPERTYGHLFAQACVDPDLPYGKFMVDSLVSRVTRDEAPTGVDGCYYDGIAVGMDYSRDHFKVAQHPLLWDPALKRPVAYNFFASLEWAAQIADTINPLGKLTMLNDSSVASFPFAFPFIDVLGAEGGWRNTDDSFLRIRAYSRHKPFCTLLKTDFSKHSASEMESYMRSCLAFGHLFGFFDISPSGANPGSSYWEHPEWYDGHRELFRRYMPLCAELCRAGWEPVQLAQTDTPGASLERFGAGRYGDAAELCFYTIRRSGDAEGAVVTVRLSDSLRPAHAEDAVVVDLLTGETLGDPGDEVRLAVPRGEVAVIAVGARQAQVERCLDRLQHMVQSRERYAAALATPRGLGDWALYQSGGEVDTTVAHTGNASFRATLSDATGSAGVLQNPRVPGEEPEDLIVRAFSKAENVGGQKDSGYSIYVDCYYKSGNKLYGQGIQFDTGTHDWQGGEVTIHPTEPIGSISLYCMFRGHTGTVWFDDVQLCLASAPDKNLLKDGGFEAAAPPAQGEAFRQTGVRLAALVQGAQRADSPAELADVAGRALTDLEWATAQETTPGVERCRRDLHDAAALLSVATSLAADRPLSSPAPQRLTEPYLLTTAPPRPAGPTTAAAKATVGVPAGTKVTVDSNYSGYNPGPLVDGKINPKTEDWTAVAWASAEGPAEHWIQLDLPASRKVSLVKVHWAWDNGAYFTSRKIAVQVLRDGKWRPVADDKVTPAEDGSISSVGFAPTETSAIRILQSPEGGPAGRPQIMWVTEVEVQ